jgi:hypothetical protein
MESFAKAGGKGERKMNQSAGESGRKKVHLTAI